jgi:hypothetical protein
MTDLKPKSTKKFGAFPPYPLAAALVARHVIATLPDSLAARRELLHALVDLTLRDTLGGDQAMLLLHSLQCHETFRLNVVLTQKKP